MIAVIRENESNKSEGFWSSLIFYGEENSRC
jgi:hypothetical protein